MALAWRILLSLALFCPQVAHSIGLADSSTKYCLVSLLEREEEWASFEKVVPTIDPEYREKISTKKITFAHGFPGLMHCFSPENSFSHIFILTHATLLFSAGVNENPEQIAGIVYYSPEPRIIPRTGLRNLVQNSHSLRSLKIASCYAKGIKNNYSLYTDQVIQLPGITQETISLLEAAKAWLDFISADNI